MLDAESVLRSSRRPLVIGMGGGGDVVGALATAEFARVYDGADPVLGGLAWERRPIDPAPGPRARDEIENVRELAPGVLVANSQTRVRESGVLFAESRMAAYLGQPTLLLTLEGGAEQIANGLRVAAEQLEADVFVFVDVGGDVLAHGDEPGLRSPLCDAVMLAVADRLSQDGMTGLIGIFGIGCDAELTPAEVLERVALVAQEGGLCGIRGLTEAVAVRLEGAIDMIPTEASAQAVRAFRGASGIVTIRGGTRSLELTPMAASTLYLDPQVTVTACGRLARAVAGAASLEEANAALGALGVRTELDLERDAVRM